MRYISRVLKLGRFTRNALAYILALYIRVFMYRAGIGNIICDSYNRFQKEPVIDENVSYISYNFCDDSICAVT